MAATDKILLAGLISVSDWGGRVQPREQDFVLDPNGVSMAVPASYSRHPFNVLATYGLSRTRDRKGKIVGHNLNPYVNTLHCTVGTNSNMDVRVVEVIASQEGHCVYEPITDKTDMSKKTIIYDDYNSRIPKDQDAIGTLTTNIGSPTPRNGIKLIEVEQPDDNDYLAIPEATAKGYAKAREGDSVNLAVPNSQTRRGRVGNQIANTLDTGCQQGAVVVDGAAYRIRKLTPRECFRLMGVDDADVDKIQAASISNTQQYKLAGNSIVVDTLYYILEQLFVCRRGVAIQ